MTKQKSEPPVVSDEQDERTSDLAAALHEVSNALTVVLGWTERAREQLGSAAASQALEIVLARAKQAQGIARAAIGARPEEACVRQLQGIVNETIVGLEPDAARRNVQIVCSMDHDAATAQVERSDSLLQVLTNLVVNAIAFSPEAGRVFVEVQRSAEELRIYVTDQGPGVPESEAQDIFRSAYSTRPGGAGIGLRHAFRLAKSANGSLKLNAHAGQGAQFEVTWPVQTMKTRVIAGTQLLILEDDNAVLDLLDVALSARGAEVTSVRTRQDFESTLQKQRFDIVMVDLSPIRETLDETLLMLRAAQPNTPLIMISGAVDDPIFPDGITVQWVRKPFDVTSLVAVLEHTLAQSAKTA